MKKTGIGSLVLGGCLVAGGVAAGDVDRGIGLYREGKYAEAEVALRGAEGVDGRAFLAEALARLERSCEAEAAAKAALEADKTHPVAIQALGTALVKQDKLDEAVERLSAALTEKPDLAYAYYWRGQAYQRKKLVARMMDDYQVFLKLAPEAPEAPAIKVLLSSLR